MGWWKAQLYDMFDIPEDRIEWAKQYIRNYPINLIDARHMSEEQINQFQGDLKAFLVYCQTVLTPKI